MCLFDIGSNYIWIALLNKTYSGAYFNTLTLSKEKFFIKCSANSVELFENFNPSDIYQLGLISIGDEGYSIDINNISKLFYLDVKYLLILDVLQLRDHDVTAKLRNER